MNKLEQKIFDEFDRYEKFSQYISKADGARIAAKIALELAKKAFHQGWSTGYAVATLDKDEIVKWEQFKQEVL